MGTSAATGLKTGLDRTDAMTRTNIVASNIVVLLVGCGGIIVVELSVSRCDG